jgi:arginyl-tRNA synthetase
VAYEFVGLEDEDFSGRKGTWIGYSADEVIQKAKALAREEVVKRNPEEEEGFFEEAASKIAAGAVRYFLLNASPDRKITFRWSEALDFNGDAAPYLQYSLARAQRILEKQEADTGQNIDYSLLSEEAEFELVKSISRLADEVLEVVKGLKKHTWGTSFQTSRLTSYCYKLAMQFSKFYDNCPVLQAKEDIKQARLHLVEAFKITMTNCLGLLGIPIIERM